jgi:hypothetical protein
VPLNTIIKPVDCRIVLARSDRRRHSLCHLVLGHVGVKECATIGGVLVYGTLAVEVPVTMALIVPYWNQCRVGLIDQRSQVMLCPGENVLGIGTQSDQVGGIECSRHVPAVNLAQLTRALGAAKSMNLTNLR